LCWPFWSAQCRAKFWLGKEKKMPSARTILVGAAIAVATIFVLNRFTQDGVANFGKPSK
jgi:hypothetical protein